MPPKSKQKQSTKAVNQETTDPPKPDWPEIKPIIPASDLELCPLLPNHILTISQLWTQKLCETYVTFLSRLPLVTTPGKPKKGEAVRVNDRFQVQDPAFADALWAGTALKDLICQPVVDGQTLDEPSTQALWGGQPLGLNPNIRIYRYRPGQHFAQHYDESNNVTVHGQAAKTSWTLLLYLTSPATGCQGGETVFYPEAPSRKAPEPAPIVAELEVGMALLHRHGKDCLIHEGREVTRGEKWVIRSDLCVKN